jgi:PncC family amidohydrolase
LRDTDVIQSKLKKIRDALVSHKKTIAVAESVTSGHLQAILTLAPDATIFYEGGITAYNARQKVRHLGVEPIHALKHNCVSESVASEMALGVAKMFQSSWGIGVTGYASTIPNAGINSLFAFFAISHEGKILASKRINAQEENPDNVEAFYAVSIIDELTRCLQVFADVARAS